MNTGPNNVKRKSLKFINWPTNPKKIENKVIAIHIFPINKWKIKPPRKYNKLLWTAVLQIKKTKIIIFNHYNGASMMYLTKDMKWNCPRKSKQMSEFFFTLKSFSGTDSWSIWVQQKFHSSLSEHLLQQPI